MNELVQEDKKIPATIAINPLVINTARASATAAKTANLPNLPIAQVEQAFATTKVLQPDNGLNEYLKKTAETSEFAELFFTEKNGFNVAYSNPTSDFVQRDEKWWQNAKEELNDQFIEPTFDQSANTFGLELSQAIVDPNSGEFLGVVKGVLPAKAFGFILNNLLERLQIGESQAVQILSLNSDNTVAVISTVDGKENNNKQTVLGGEKVAEAVKSLLASTQPQNSGKERSVKEFQIEPARRMGLLNY